MLGNSLPYRRRYTCDPMPIFPEDGRIVERKEQCCREGYKSNTLAVLQVMFMDFGGKGGF